MDSETRDDPEMAALVTSQGLAEHIRRDLLAGGFRCGDRFMTVRQTAVHYKASPMTTYRAMRRLAKKGFLEIRKQAGTFVGPAIDRAGARVKTVHLILGPDEPFQNDRLLVEGELEGLMVHLRGASVQVNCLSAEDPMGFLEALYEESVPSPKVLGAVLIRVTRNVRMFFAERMLPAVVIGHCEQGIELAHVDIDQTDLGRQMASFLLDKGYDRLGLLMREHWYPGDDLLLNGLQQALRERPGLDGHALQVRSLPPEETLTRSLVRALLSETDRPNALICRAETAAVAAVELAKELELAVPGDLGIVSAASTDFHLRNVVPTISGMECMGWEMGKQAAKFLIRLLDGEPPGDLQLEIPPLLAIRDST